MKKNITLHVHYIDEFNGTIKELTNDLNRIGIDISIKKSLLDKVYDVELTYDLTKLTMHNSRFAGKKRHYMEEKPKIIYIEDIKTNIKKYGRIEAAAQLNMHYTYMYKLIRKAKAEGKDFIYV